MKPYILSIIPIAILVVGCGTQETREKSNTANTTVSTNASVANPISTSNASGNSPTSSSSDAAVTSKSKPLVWHDSSVTKTNSEDYQWPMSYMGVIQNPTALSYAIRQNNGMMYQDNLVDHNTNAVEIIRGANGLDNSIQWMSSTWIQVQPSGEADIVAAKYNVDDPGDTSVHEFMPSPLKTGETWSWTTSDNGDATSTILGNYDVTIDSGSKYNYCMAIQTKTLYPSNRAQDNIITDFYCAGLGLVREDFTNRDSTVDMYDLTNMGSPINPSDFIGQ